MIGLSPQLPAALTLPSTTPLAEHLPISALTVTLAGQAIVGAVVLLTVIPWVQLAALPLASVATYARWMAKRFGQVMLLVTSPAQETVTLTQLSVAVPPAKSGGGTCEAHGTVTLGGQVMVGAVVSLTVTVNVHETTPKPAFDAVQTTGVDPSGKVELGGGWQRTVAPAVAIGRG